MQVKDSNCPPALKSSIIHQPEPLAFLDKLWGDFWGCPVQSQVIQVSLFSDSNSVQE